jgi:thioredoxin-related protein
MKSLIVFVSIICLTTINSIQGHCQAGKLPPFAIMQANGKIFRAHQLPVGKPIVIVYFSPECDHCDILMKDFLKKEASLREASVVMITHLAVEKVSKFVKQYGLNKYANVYVGTEGTWLFVKNYYKIVQTPFIALHDRNGNLVKLFRDEGALPDVVNQLGNLNRKN